MNDMTLLGTEIGQRVFSAAWPRTVVSSCAGPVRRAHLPEAMAAMKPVRARMNGAGGSSPSVAGFLSGSGQPRRCQGAHGMSLLTAPVAAAFRRAGRGAPALTMRANRAAPPALRSPGRPGGIVRGQRASRCTGLQHSPRCARSPATRRGAAALQPHRGTGAAPIGTFVPIGAAGAKNRRPRGRSPVVRRSRPPWSQ